MNKLENRREDIQRMRILVTGGAGFLGSHLCEELLHQGAEIVCLDNLCTGRKENVEHLFSDKRFHFLQADVSNLPPVPGPINYVAHLVSRASPVDFLREPVEIMRTGALGTLATLQLALEKQARYLLASTSECYGDPQVSPQPEEYWGNVNPIGPRSPYDEAKRFSEALTMAFHRQYGLDICIVRIFNTYGPRMREDDGRVVPNFICQALNGTDLTVFGDGSQTRSFCYVSDMIVGLTKALFSSYSGPFNLGNPRELTICQLAELVVTLTHCPSRIVMQEAPLDDPQQRCPDIRKAQQLFGWSPTISLEEGLTEVVKYFATRLGQREALRRSPKEG